MSSKPRIPKGTRDFNSQQIAKREYIFNIIKSNFKKFGFTPIETPSFELSETLLGKYGNEGDRLIFKILNSGEKVKKADLKALKNNEFFNFSNSVSEKALRYDLTVPFARYVVQYQNEITFPFKRYQIQPVWRADRPQRGRFQEFYQCDADVVGSKSLLQEIEFIQLYDSVFYDLKLEGVSVKINNRKILSGIAELIGADNKITDFTVALDKLDKIGIELVKDEMLKNNQEWKDREEKLETDEDMIRFQGDYTKELIEATDYPTFDIEAVNKTFMEWEHHKHDDIMGYRNNSYKSLMTGTVAPKHHTPWKEALDDSKETYLKN